MTLLDQNELNVENHLSSQTIQNMAKAAKWMRFCAIVGFVFTVFMIVIAFLIPDFFASFGGAPQTSQMMSNFGGAMTIGYLIAAIIIFIPNLFLFQSAVSFAKYTRDTDNLNMELGFRKLHALFLFFGIIVIIYIVILLFAVLGFAMIA